MRLSNTTHTTRPWRIHELTHDFRLEDVWALPTPGGPDDSPARAAMVERATRHATPRAPSLAVRAALEGGELLGLGRPAGTGYGDAP